MTDAGKDNKTLYVITYDLNAYDQSEYHSYFVAVLDHFPTKEEFNEAMGCLDDRWYNDLVAGKDINYGYERPMIEKVKLNDLNYRK